MAVTWRRPRTYRYFLMERGSAVLMLPRTAALRRHIGGNVDRWWMTVCSNTQKSGADNIRICSAVTGKAGGHVLPVPP